MKDAIIIGGGISGLYCAYRLLLREPNIKVLVLEKNGILGGRIKTVKDRYMSVESGAGRFHNGNLLLLKLLEELELAENIVKIGELEYTWDNNNKTPANFKAISSKLRKTISISKKYTKEQLQNYSYYDYIVKILGKNSGDEILSKFGYSSEITDMNAYDAIHLMKEHLISNKEFFALKGGLTQVIDGLEKKIKELGGQIIINRNVETIDYEKEKETFHVKCNGILKTYNSRHCICAVTSSVLSKYPLFKPVKKYTRFIKELPLCRIYSKYPTKNGVWFSDVKRMTMNNKIRMIIPINEEQGVIMISYTDNRYAKYWKRLYDTNGIDSVNREHKKILDKELNKNIPEPINTKVFYSEKGVAYFSPGFDSTTMLEKIMKPYEDINLYACGENYSRFNNQWMEGALDTSEYILKKMLKNLRTI